MKGFTVKQRKWNAQAIAASIALILTLLLFSRSLFCDFVNLDDPIFVLNNPFIRNFDSNLFSFAFSSSTLDLWMPLTWLSFAIDYHFWGLNPVGYHLTNVMLHSANSALVALISARLINFPYQCMGDRTLWSLLFSRRLLVPLLAALIFSLHPLRVESVAWVTERKDVMNGFFTLLSLHYYLQYGDHEVGRDYILSLLFFALSLMSKPVSVVLPVIFLLLDYYPFSRQLTKSFLFLVKEKIPFLILSSAAALFTFFLFSQRHLLVGLAKLSLLDRVLLSGNALFEYLKMMLFPIGILPFYEMPDSVGSGELLKTVIVSIFMMVSLLSIRKSPWLFTGVLCFLLPLLPVLSFFQNGGQAFAARYTYLPSIAPSLMASIGFVIGYDKIQKQFSGLWFLPGVAALLLLLVYAGITGKLISVWNNTETLWTRVIKLAPATTAYMDRGVFYIINNRAQEARHDFSSAIELSEKSGKKPDYNAYAFRGVALMDMKQYNSAIKDFDAAVAIKSHPTYFLYRGMALQALGRNKEAEADFKLAGPNPPPIDKF